MIDIDHDKVPAALLPPSPPPPNFQTPPHRKIMICVPCMDAKPLYATTLSCTEASNEAGQLGWSTCIVARHGDSLLVRARDVLVSTFYYSDCTDMLFVDSDISWPQGTFVKIMSHPVDFIGGIYRGRGEPPLYVCHPLEYEGRPSINITYPSGIAEVRGVGTGFLRLTKAAVQRIIDYLPDDHWYTDEKTAPGLKIHHMFDVIFDAKLSPGVRLRSEDYVFCDLYRRAGGRVYADTELTLFHSGMSTYEGHFGNWLRAGGAQMGPVVPSDGPLPPPPSPGGTMLDVAKATLAACEAA